MLTPHEVAITTESLERFTPLVGAVRVAEAARMAEATRSRHAGRVLWNVNSTAVGGGVAEMLPSLLAYARGHGIDARWLVIEGTPDFFAITKRLHHALHGSAGDGSPLGDAERAVYEGVMSRNGEGITRLVKSGDVVILHDPQTAGLASHLAAIGAHVVWRCHIGQDEVNAEVDRAWKFLAPYLRPAEAHVFSRAEYIPSVLRTASTAIIQPSIDPFSTKNLDLEASVVRAILERTGIVAAAADAPEVPVAGGAGARVVRKQARFVSEGDRPSPETPLIVQVSRWDPLKDPIGVMRGYASLVNGTAPGGAHLMLAGPEVSAVADDPEAAVVLERTIAAWRELPEAARRRIHLVALPTDDLAENALMVNALQRHASVIVQKSLHEGFGLTVTEAMWKARPIIATAVGGIQDQIVHGEHGLLVRDAADWSEFAGLLAQLIEDAPLAKRLGEGARERARDHYLAIRHLTQYGELLGGFKAQAA